MVEDGGSQLHDEAGRLIDQAEGLLFSDYLARQRAKEFVKKPESEGYILEAFVIGEVEVFNEEAGRRCVLHPLGEIYSSLGEGNPEGYSVVIEGYEGVIPQEDDVVVIFNSKETGQHEGMEILRVR